MGKLSSLVIIITLLNVILTIGGNYIPDSNDITTSLFSSDSVNYSDPYLSSNTESAIYSTIASDSVTTEGNDYYLASSQSSKGVLRYLWDFITAPSAILKKYNAPQEIRTIVASIWLIMYSLAIFGAIWRWDI